MTESMRDRLIRLLDESDPEGGVTDPDEWDEFWGRQADAIIAAGFSDGSHE